MSFGYLNKRKICENRWEISKNWAMIQREVILEGGQPWGFRIHGGAESKTPLRVSKVNPGSKASLRGIKENDLLTSINGENTQNLTNNEAHNLIKKSGDFLKLGLNEDSDGTVPKRRQYRTIHHETHQETVKKSSVRYTLKESTENSPLNAELKRKPFQQFKSDEFADDDQKDSKVNDGQRVAVVRNIPILQNSTSSSSTSSTLVPEGKHDISSEHAIASRQSSYSNCSSIPDEGGLLTIGKMNNGQERISKSKKRRQRRKKFINLPFSEEINYQSEVEPDDLDDNIPDIILEPTLNTLDVLKLKRIEHKYKVESPKELKINPNKAAKKLKTKSKSLDDDDDDFVKIQELSETSENEDANKIPVNVVISEASSEENLLETPNSGELSLNNLLSLKLNDDNEIEDASDIISPEEEKALRSFLGGLKLVSSPEESAKELYEKTRELNDLKLKKLQKRKELQEYFTPQSLNPRFLDDISEETSDLSDKECGNCVKFIEPFQEVLCTVEIRAKAEEPAEKVFVDDSSVDSSTVSESDGDNAKSEENIKINEALEQAKVNVSSLDYTKIPNILINKESENVQELEDVSKFIVTNNIDENNITNNNNIKIAEDIKNEEDFKRENILKHVILNSQDSNKTDSQKLQEYDCIKKINTEITERITNNKLINLTRNKSTSPNTSRMEYDENIEKFLQPESNFIQSRIKTFSNEFESESMMKNKNMVTFIPIELEPENEEKIDNGSVLKKLLNHNNDSVSVEELNVPTAVLERTIPATENIDLKEIIAPEKDMGEYIIPIEIHTNKISSGSNREPPIPPPRKSKAFLLRKQQKSLKNHDRIEIPVSKDIIYTTSVSPTPRSASTSSESEESSQCTAKYNPNSSIADVTSLTKDEESALFEPTSLRNIVLKLLVSLPFGEEILKELAEVSKAIEKVTNKIPFKGIPLKTMSGWYTEKDVDENSYEDENQKLIHLHQRFLTRRKFEDSSRNSNNENDTVKVINVQSNKREEEVKSPNRILTIIREEPSETDLFEDNSAAERLKAKDLGEWLKLARHKSKSTSNLDCTTIPINNLQKSVTLNNNNQNEQAKCSKSRRRSSLPQEIYEKQLIDIMEKEREIQRELEKLEDEKRKIQAENAPSHNNIHHKEFQMDEFYVSKNGDFAELRENTSDKKERPQSMPIFPTEFFRQQMYDEYMDKFTEREERKQQKVIKITSSNDLNQEKEITLMKSREIIHPIEIEQEFMDKVKSKLRKNNLSTDKSIEENSKDITEKNISSNKEPSVIILDGGKVKGVETLPKHLQEIVEDLTAPQEDNSIWSPGLPHRRPSSPNDKSYQRTESQSSLNQNNNNNEPISPIWTPKSTNSSPVIERKEFRPVNFNSPVLSRRNRTKSETIQQSPEFVSFSAGRFRKPPEDKSDTAINFSSNFDRKLPNSQSSPLLAQFSTTTPRLPRIQNPTVTLLQKAREGQLPRGAHYLDQDRKPPNDRPPIKYPGEMLHQIRSDYTSESDTEKTKKMTEISARKFEGVGPTTKDGMPLILRSEVRNEDQSKWYKRMYDTIHKQKPHRDEYVTIRYKQKRAKYPYSTGYLSEPEPGAYDSDFTEYKYQTLDRRRPTSTQKYLYFNDIPSTTSMSQNIPDRSYSYTDVARNTNEKYDNNQPGRIENYRPGHSSISDKEAKRWWDEVMDIFDGHLQQQQSRRVPPPQNPRSFINQALKESGYESDSTLVFKRKQENAANHLNSTEQKEAYKQIQKGGDVPFQGLRKSVPERPKETDLVEFCPISPTLTKIRIHKSIIPQNDVVVPQQEFFCYPVNVQYNQTKTFANFKRTAPSSIKLNRATNTPTPPPSPPKRKSSRNNSTLRLISTMKIKTEKSPLYKRHETCFTSGSTVDKIIYKLSSPNLNKRRENSKAGVIKKVNTTSDLKTKISSTCSTSKDLKNSTRKVHSTTGKSKMIYKSNSNGNINKNKSSTESLSSTRTPTPVKNLKSEKKKFGFSLPLIKSNKLSKSPDDELLSPVEVKKGIKNISDSSVHYKKSFAVLASSKNKTLPIKVGITEKGKNILKRSNSAKNSKKSNNKASTTESLTTKKDTKISDMKQKCFSKSTGSEYAHQQYEILKKTDPYSNNFFRSLFLQDVNYASINPQPKTWIMEKTDQLTRQRRSLGESNVGAMKIYLKHTKPVSDSKFLSLDYFTRSRSASPKSVTFNDKIEKRSRSSPSKLIFSQTSRPISPAIISRKKSPILKQTDTNLKLRSPSPPKKFIFTQTSRPVSPIIIRKLSPSSVKPTPVINSPSKLYFSQTVRPISPEIKRKSFQSPPPSPGIARSPSCRRIMQFKEQNKLNSYYQDLNNSTTSLDSFNSEDYHIYLKDCFGSEKNEKFKDLNEFYSDIEKVGELEQKFNLRPRKRKENEIIDYDRWMEVRTREKAEHELKHLYNHLKYHEKEKGFLFMPKDVEKVKWKRELDRGLRIKEKSVENLKDGFERLKNEESEREAAKRRELAYSKDTYKPLWRGTSVINLANILTERRSQSEGRVKTTRQKLMETRNIFTHGINPKIWSSLSNEQVTNLKRQLQEIYGDETNSVKEIAQKKFEVEVPQKFIEKNFVPKLTVRRNSESSKHDLMSENEKKVISQNLSKEVLQKIANKRKENKLALPLVIGKEVLGAKATQDTNLNKISAMPVEPLVKTNALQIPTSEAESASTADGSTDDSTKTVINLQDVQKKVEYFEKAKDLETFVPTVYKAADEEALEEDEPASETIKKTKLLLPQSKSYQNLKEYFGETELKKFATLPLSATKKFDYKYIKKPQLRALDISPIRTISEANSIDSFIRSRSASPSSYSEEAQNLLKKGEVRKLRRQFEFFEDFFGEKKLKRSRSENDLKNLTNNVVVDDLRRKYEYPIYSGRGRSRTKKGGMVSPVWLKPEDRYMPHINIISKIASLYSFSKKQKSDGNSKSMEELAEILGCPIGEVEKMKEKFDKIRAQEEISLMGHMYTSSPNIKELRDITPYLTANWIAHKYPRIEDNPRSASSPNASRNTSLVMRKERIKSSSPIRKIKRNVEKPKEITETSSRYTKEPELLPPPPPPPPKSQGGLKSQDQESPRKYVENEVTIHYKTPIRTEIKEYVSEEELAHRQAEIMKKIYENEKKKKYLQVSTDEQQIELQDMKSRRHTDNFIPSQKSPISLNRYDDFEELTGPPKPRRRSPEPRLVAKALYNFVGQTAKELTFRKGELIYVRRQIDKNWYEGELNAMVGLFPVNYVEIVPYEGIKIPTNRKAHEGQARAKYNFVAQTHLELSLARGELVTITRKIDDNWFEGKIGGRKGIFPVSYVEVLIDPSEVLPTSSKPVAAPAAHSLLLNGSSQGKESMGSHSYTPNIPNPITNRPQLLSENNGFHHAKAVQLSGTGTYSTLPKFKSPSMNQTLHIETQTEPVAYRALYKYTPQNDDELELLEGDTVYVLEKCDDGWFVGSSDRTGAFGTFPGNYVEKI